ncbi:DUF485 domain-containing protein [Sulfurospirillum arcachonense]|uniref:DUF485 domain-containing protein n=1 Tax=Sulfurospirillum arcachonense TaxID=57666 RepID=UPI00046A345B|nr:DUF485 domain-containing protein [Sulfurospirillum arcachonense]
MNQEIYERVKNNPKFSELVKKRSSFAFKLSLIMLSVYYIFIMIIAFSPETLGKQIGTGVTSIGIPIGLSIIILCFILTGIYTDRANNEFDKLTDEIKDDVRFDV